jgi:DNA-binding NarL/FixJ family response regulator
MSTALREHDVRTHRVTAFLCADDAISRAGLASQLRSMATLAVVDEPAHADVAILVVDEIDEAVSGTIRSLLRAGSEHVVVVAAHVDDGGVLSIVEAGACALLRRSDVTVERVSDVVTAAVRGHGTLPPDLLGSLLSQLGRLERTVLRPRGYLLNGFSSREVDVLRLVADGYGTDEIAHTLAYSERTVKNVIHGVTSRFNLRNRCHAVAYAVRAGVI